MCEPHTARHQRDTEATPQQDITASTSITDTTMSEKATSTHSPLSPPGSPSTKTIQPQSIDVLASQLGSSSLSQYNHDNHTLSTVNIPESALSPISLPDGDVVNVSSMLSQYPRSMEIDVDRDSNMAALQNNSTPEKQTIPATSINTPFTPLPPIAVDPTALAEVPANTVTSMYTPNAFGGFEVDEGYCEDDDDFSWLPSVASLRAASTPDGVKKRYDLGYRRSVDAASRCRNTIHSVPRMRRRDKKRSKHSQSAAGSLRSRSDSQASSMVAAQ